MFKKYIWPTRLTERGCPRKQARRRLQINFVIERIINVWNFLPHTVDFSLLSKFKRPLSRVDFSVRFYGMRSRSCFYIECVCFFCFLFFYGQNVSASFLCFSCPAFSALTLLVGLTWIVPEKGPLNGCLFVCSCPALVLVLIMSASSCSVDLSK